MAGPKKVKAVPGQGIPAAVDPNKAVTASNEAEAQSDAEVLAEQTSEKQASEQEFKDRVQDNVDAEQSADEVKESAADAAFAALPDSSATAAELMDKLEVDELHENSNGEFFTAIDRAIHSEGGKAHRVKTHTK
jgi:hypothetical protein